MNVIIFYQSIEQDSQVNKNHLGTKDQLILIMHSFLCYDDYRLLMEKIAYEDNGYPYRII